MSTPQDAAWPPRPAPAGLRPSGYVAHVATPGPTADTDANPARERDAGERWPVGGDGQHLLGRG